MARYIDAGKLIKAIEENQRNTEHHKDGRGKQIHVGEHRHFIKMVFDQPTLDVVEVVRCKDCTQCYHNPSLNTFRCGRFMAVVDPNHFCSCGERNSNEN